jgi:hypothetical protein
VIELDLGPGLGAGVAVGALTGPVTVGGIVAVAAAAVLQVGMREIYITPVGSVMALGTLEAVVFGRRF